eukprot:g7018.t1
MTKRESILRLCLLFAILTDVSRTVFAHYKGDTSRALLQRDNADIIINSETARLEEELEGARRGDSISITIPEIELRGQLSITVDNLKIKGNSSRSRATIKCVTEDARIEIKSNGVVLENLVIRDCRGPAVRMINEAFEEYDPFDPSPAERQVTKETKATFRNVGFINNKQSSENSYFSTSVEGGALHISQLTSALVEHCEFERNEADLGGAIRIYSGSLEVRNTSFTENIASISGGAISGSLDSFTEESATTLLIKDSTFLRNEDLQGGEDSLGLVLQNGAPLETSEFLSFPSPQSSGGAVYVQGFNEVKIEGCLFDGNIANPAAGAIFISDNDEVKLSNNTFSNNIAFSHPKHQRDHDLEQGGAIYVAFTKTRSKIEIEKCIFENNTASYGGGLLMVMPLVTTAEIKECHFINNTAHLGGGGFVLRNTIQVGITNTKFIRNRATAGGAILFTNGAGARFIQGPDPSRDSLFQENIALDGGACFFLGAGQVATQRLSFIRNKAQRNGGALCFVESLASGSIGLQQSFFEANTARRGGALFMDSIATLLVRAPDGSGYSQFHKNKALAGGAIYLRPSSQVKNVVFASAMNFTGNEAVARLEDIYNAVVAYSDQGSRHTGVLGRKLHETYFEDKDDGSDVLLRTTAEDPCSPGGGGAICLVLTEVPERASVKVEMANSLMTGNKAMTGGGMFIATKKRSFWSESCEVVGTTSESLTDRPCRQLTFRNVRMNSNTAQAAGGAVFASDANQIHYSTESNNLRDFEFQRLSRMDPTDLISKNRVLSGGYGAQYASNAVRLEVESPPFLKVANGRSLLVAEHASGTSLPVIRLRVVDSFGNTVSNGISDSQMKVTVSSNRGIISGQLVSTAEAGIVVFDSLIVTADPDIYTLTFQPEENIVSSLFISLSIRRCKIGEHNITQGKICSICQPGFYGFDPSIPCQACESQAKCHGGASVVPKDGYWHSNPFSPQFHECLVPDACSYPHRETKLTKALSKGIKPVERVFLTDEYPQCRKGYKDVLCGSCDSEYGHKPGGVCIECRGSLTTYVIVTVVALWQLVLLGFTIRSALASIRDMQDMRAIMVQHNGDLRAFPKSYQNKLPPTPSSSYKLKNPGNAGEICLSASTKEEEICPVDEGTSEKRTLPRSTTASARNLTSIDHIVAAETVSETIKIAVNFLQVTSVAVSINVEWTQTVKNMLEIENTASGFSNGSAFAPLTCLLKSGLNRTIHGMVLRVAFPVALIVFVIFLFFLNWLRIRSTQKKGIEYLHSRSVICILVALFFCYESINQELMRVVNCVELDVEESSDETGYHKYAIARGEYWGEDTSFKCFEGTHLTLVAILGIPGLTFFSFGIPAFLLVFLLYNRERKRIYDQDFLNTYGFVYQNYTPSFVYWEVSIMLRKACIGGIVVFAYPLGANLQGIMSLGVLMTALVLHLIATPFKYKILNVLESFSLVVSIFTFYAGIVFNDENTSEPAKVLLSILLIIINASLFIMFVARVFVDVDKFITAKLRLLGVVDIPKRFSGRCMKLTRVILEKATLQVQLTLQSQASRFSKSVTRGEKKPRHQNTLENIEEGDLELSTSQVSSRNSNH